MRSSRSNRSGNGVATDASPIHFKQVSVHRQRHCHVSWQDDLVDFLQRIRKAYVEGLCWVLVYYYQAGPTQASTCDCDTVAPFVSFCQGCPSWTWFYPYHYALETRGPMGVAGDHLVCDSLCFTFRDFRPFRSEAICFRLDWLWQPEVRRDQLFPVSWLGVCMRGSMVQHHFKLLMRQVLFLHQPPYLRPGQPFQPFQQLMSVLPPVSAEEAAWHNEAADTR